MNIWILIVASVFANTASAGSKAKTVYFLHGLGIDARPYEYAVPLKKLFRKNGYALTIAPTPANDSIARRANQVAELIRANHIPGEKVHIIGHSMGGLDARYAVSNLKLAPYICSVTTLATPHRGSVLADWMIEQLNMGGSRASFAQSVLRTLGANRALIEPLTRDHMIQQFNKNSPNVDGVIYKSVGFAQKTPVTLHSTVPVIWFTHSKMTELGEPENDGFVSVQSSRWGEYLGTFTADHYSETGPIPTFGGHNYKDTFEMIIKNFECT